MLFSRQYFKGIWSRPVNATAIYLILVFDFKTSSYYKGDKLKEASRQLSIYQKAIEDLYGLKVDS